MKKLFLILLILMVSISLLNACDQRKDGNGKRVTKTRKVENFSYIAVAGSYVIDVRVGKPRSLSITTDSNLLSLITTKVDDNTLYIKTKPNINLSADRPIVVTITVPKLKGFSASGANSVTIKHIAAEQFFIKVSGVSNVTLMGRAKTVKIHLSGTGEIAAKNLLAQNVKAHLSGAGHIVVNAENTLDVDVSGVGNLSYYGNPKILNQHVSGLGKIVKAN